MVSGPEAQPVMAYWTPRVSKRASAEAKHARKRTSFIKVSTNESPKCYHKKGALTPAASHVLWTTL